MIDVKHQISEVRRDVGGKVLEAGEARVITVSQSYDGTLDDLWDACTNPERIPRWFLPVSGDLRPGGRYQLEGNAGGTIETQGKVERFQQTLKRGCTPSTPSPPRSPGSKRCWMLIQQNLPDDDCTFRASGRSVASARKCDAGHPSRGDGLWAFHIFPTGATGGRGPEPDRHGARIAR